MAPPPLPPRPALPIDAVIPEIVAALEQDRAVVVSAPPGSGKTTVVPSAILDAGIAGEVWVLQPRRIAARAAARRVAFLRGGRIGEVVGYQVRHDRRVGRDTRIRFVTEGILVRRLVQDPFLTGVGAVVLDEFHERSLEADLALAMLAEIRSTVREDLWIAVMSATLDAQPIVDFLAPCGRVTATGTLFDVAVEYLPSRGTTGRQRTDAVAHAVTAAMVPALAETTGDVLVFLPGVGEIRACMAALAGGLQRRGIDARPLYGRLSAADQDAAIVAGPRRKVVFATNVAETSITIEGVTAVVDSGLARVLRHDAGRGLDRLELQRISRAAADQRRGRAGRTAPGRCYRLWSAAEDRGLPAFDLPEIRRLDLAGTALTVRAFASRDPRQFGWFEAPEPATLDAADALLRLLGAVTDTGLTDLGVAMLRHPLHPRLARMMEEGGRRRCRRAAAEFAALLSERDIQRDGGPRRQSVDLFTLRGLLHTVEAAGFAASTADRIGVDARAARAVAKVRDQIAGRADAGADGESEPDPDDLIKTLLSGYPDRVGKRERETVTEGVLASGRGFALAIADHENLGELLLALRVRETGDRRTARSVVDLACSLREEWLDDVFPGSVREEESMEFDPRRGSVTTIRRRMFGALVLDQRAAGRPDPAQIEMLFAAELRRDPWRYLGAQEELRGFLARLAWLRQVLPEAALPAIGDVEVAAAAADVCAGLTRLGDIAKRPVLAVLRQNLPAGVADRVDRDAPERVALPSGRRARVDYVSGEQPFLAARLQEFFGSGKTPLLAGGAVPLVLHLLAPNHRPVQITSDLASFWKNAYPGVRSELQRRYPKHAWPEDPLAAVAESRPRRRR